MDPADYILGFINSLPLMNDNTTNTTNTTTNSSTNTSADNKIIR